MLDKLRKTQPRRVSQNCRHEKRGSNAPLQKARAKPRSVKAPQQVCNGANSVGVIILPSWRVNFCAFSVVYGDWENDYKTALGN